jgi:hypothetical protein
MQLSPHVPTSKERKDHSPSKKALFNRPSSPSHFGRKEAEHWPATNLIAYYQPATSISGAIGFLNITKSVPQARIMHMASSRKGGATCERYIPSFAWQQPWS